MAVSLDPGKDGLVMIRLGVFFKKEKYPLSDAVRYIIISKTTALMKIFKNEKNLKNLPFSFFSL